MQKTDVIVIGSGIAGAIAAISAADEGRQVYIYTKTPELLSGNTPYAQGGIIYKGMPDSPKSLKNDIMTAGDGQCREVAVDQLVNLGPKLVKDYLIERFSVDFDKNGKLELDLTAEGAHSHPRIIHAKDKTGLEIHKSVLYHLKNHPNIEIFTDYTAVDLLTLSHHSREYTDIYKKPACFGALMLNNKTGKIDAVYSANTILATGGLGQIYIHTTNPIESTGDGIALAWRAGARCFGLQFIQFHPTTLYSEHDRFLLSESMRGEGAILVDKNGYEFMKDFHHQGNLAPRDIVSRSIHQTMLKSGHPCVYLDISFKESKWLRERFPTIYNHCLKTGVDITKEPVPVVPAAHYSCGGVGVNLKGRTSLQRLYAVGEVSATGVHGANRLASTSLLESVVWGHLAGKEAARKTRNTEYYPEINDWVEESQDIDPALIQQDWLTIKNTMWNYVGLIRTKQRLHRAETTLRHLQTEVESFYKKAKMTKEIVELRNGVQTAIAVASQTKETPRSMGAHYLEED
jgi:L-aspartate oxidase